MADKTKVFVPKDFDETEGFHEQVSRYLAWKSADYLWIQNPQEPYTSWNCASLYKNGSICIGKYRILIGRRIACDDKKAEFQGAFACRDVLFACGQVVLDLETKNGILSFEFSGSADAFAQLDAGIRYLMPLEETDDCAAERGFLSDFYNPVFTMSQSGIFSAHITPCEITDYRESYIEIPKVLLESHFLTPTGEPMACRPLTGAALVFERTASSAAVTEQETALSGFDFYLGIRGEFACGHGSLAPGLSGGEYFSVGKGIRFEPGQNALLSKTAVLSQATAPWLQVQGEYYVSGAGSSFYTLKDGKFRPFAMKAADLEEYSDCFPMLPWLHAELEAAEEGSRAEELLCGQRQRILMEQSKRTVSRSGMDQEDIAVTPGGICIGIRDQGRIWNWIGLGNLAGSDRPDLCLTGDLGLARQEFLKKDCFVVITSAEEFAAYGGTGGLSVFADGWRVSLPKDRWEENGVLVILKYNRSFSIAEKLAGLPALTELMDRACKDGEEVEDFHDFLQAVTDRDFEGMVLLNAQAAGEGLPDAVGEVISGVSDLRAVYTAVNSSKITAENGKIRIGRSAAAAFIYYQEDNAKASAGKCFKTTGLSVRIAASKMISFRSRSELYLQTLLGENAGCCLVMNGTIEQDGANSSCRFYLDSEMVCKIADSAVESIRIDTVRMLAEGEKKIFILGGRLAFTEEDGCDLFSYSSLIFENLYIIMEAGAEKLSENVSEMRFLTENSLARKGSLTETFGASIEKYYARMQEQPDRLGYRSVNTPVGQAELEGLWNGIVYRIAIGRDGNLGSGASFGVSLLLAWSGTSYYFGVRETDLNAFSLSGVLGFGFGGLELVQAEERLMLKLCNVGIKLLNFTIPKDSADLYVFGEMGKLGWYMGYGEEIND